MLKFSLALFGTLALFLTTVLSAPEPVASPYGACSHLVREEFKNRETTMRLMHAVGHLPGNIEIDVPLNYAHYYSLEGLLRFKKLRSSN